MKKKVSKTNATTRDILQFLFNARIFAWRENVLPVPVVRKGLLVALRPGSKNGVPDIMGIIPPKLFTTRGNNRGVPLFIEVKTGKDRLRPEQIGFIKNARDSGSIVMVVKDFQDFKQQWDKLCLMFQT